MSTPDNDSPKKQSKVPHKEWIMKLTDMVKALYIESLTTLSNDAELFDISNESNRRVIDRVIEKKLRPFQKDISTFLEEVGAPRRQRSSRAEDAPKRAETAYMAFCRMNRASYKKDNPDMTNPDVTRKMSAVWKNMTDKDKSEFIAIAEKDKARFMTEMTVYQDETNDLKDSKDTKKKTAPGPNILYYNEHRSSVKLQFPGTKPSDITKKLSKMWNDLSGQEKDVYKMRSQEMKALLKIKSQANDEEEDVKDVNDVKDVKNDGEDVKEDKKTKKTKKQKNKE